MRVQPAHRQGPYSNITDSTRCEKRLHHVHSTHTDHIGATEVYFKSEKVGDLHSNRGLRLPITVLEASLRKGTKKNSGEPYYNTANKA